eukprot:gene723-8975_t
MLRQFSKVKSVNFKLINSQHSLKTKITIRKFSTEKPEEKKINLENIVKNETVSTEKTIVQPELSEKDLLKQRLKLIGIGFTGGCVGTVAGIGGGVIMVPLMAAFTTLTRHQMTATSLFGLAVTAISSTASFLYMGANIDITTSIIIGTCAMITANLGARYGSKLNQVQLAKFFGYFCLLIGLFVPLFKYFRSDEERKEISGKYFIHALSGCCIGFLSGLIGIGGAVFYVPLLLSTTAMPQIQIIGTSLLATLLPSLSGCLTHFKLGNLILANGIFLAIGTFAGGVIGSKIASKTNEDALRIFFGTLMVFVGLRQIRISNKKLKEMAKLSIKKPNS